MSMDIRGLNMSYGDRTIFKDFNISFSEGDITCLLGPSGCGKTTLLNIIGGLTIPDSGTFTGFDNKRFSYVFQQPRLLPWRSVKGNIEFVLDDTLPLSARSTKADELIHKVRLEGFADFYPSQLSGGMSQRVSIARAFAYAGDVILMDEPLSSLDESLKVELTEWFKQIWNQDRRTVIFVTHDEREAAMLGAKVQILGSDALPLIPPLPMS